MVRPRSLVLLVALITSALVGSAAANAGIASKQTVTESAPAQLALQRALAVFAPDRVDARYRQAVSRVDPRDATLVLRDLVAAKARLSRADRRLANALLARPTDGPRVEGSAGWNARARASKKRFCNTRFCIHWVRKTNERPSLADNNPNNNRPDYVDKTIANMNTVWSKEIGAYGYKRPLRDGRSGGHHGGNPNRRIDIFISNIGNQGLYGYCTTDDPRAHPNRHRQNSAYCVIDDDFRPAEFPPPSASRNNANKVTLAHEFFHAVQFAYDTFDNRAMMEGTATWMEDQVFTAINDNRQYLSRSPLGPNPWAPLDLFQSSGPFANWQYGTWIFYRFLSENATPGPNDDKPQVIRQIWQQAVGKTRNGFGAIAQALANRGTSVVEQMTTFGEWNSAPRASGHYREGNQGAGYPTAGTTTFQNVPGLGDGPNLGPGEGLSVEFEMLRRSNDYFRLVPSGTGPGSTLEFDSVAIPGGAVTDVSVIVFRTGGAIDAPVVVTNTAFVDFDDAGVVKVIIVFTNAGRSDFVDPNFWDFDVVVNP